MSIEWYDAYSKDGVATLYENNITLNKNTIRNIEDAYSVMLGIDYDNKKVIIKPLTKEMDLRGDIPSTQKYKITIRSSYGRISNKEFMRKIEKIGGFSLMNEPKKFPAVWDDSKKIIIIEM